VFSSQTSKLTYKKEGDRFVFHGQTTILNGDVADWFVVRAVDGASAENSLFIIRADSSGINKQKMDTLGRKAADYCNARFDAVSTQTNALIGTEGDADQIARKTLAHVYPLIAAEAVGLARAALQNAIKYSKERHTFGQPIASYQAVNFMMAEIAKDTEAARLMAWKAALATDNGNFAGDEQKQAKLFATDMAMKAATDAVQIYGGYGYSREYPVEKLMRDAKMLQIHLNNSHEMKVELGKKVLAGAGCS
jgi:acyl-CoA dehydrogenase